MSPPVSSKLHAALKARFSDAPEPPSNLEYLLPIAARGSCRDFTDEPVDRALLDSLIATAFSAPTKSDLQQRDVLIVTDTKIRAVSLLPALNMPTAPYFLNIPLWSIVYELIANAAHAVGFLSLIHI